MALFKQTAGGGTQPTHSHTLSWVTIFHNALPFFQYSLQCSFVIKTTLILPVFHLNVTTTEKNIHYYPFLCSSPDPATPAPTREILSWRFFQHLDQKIQETNVMKGALKPQSNGTGGNHKYYMSSKCDLSTDGLSSNIKRKKEKRAITHLPREGH